MTQGLRSGRPFSLVIALPFKKWGARLANMGSAPDLQLRARDDDTGEFRLISKGEVMPRFIVERGFAAGVSLPMTQDGARACMRIVGGNAEAGVTWLHSYVSADRRTMFCVYEAPSPEAVRHVARRNDLPVDRITEVSVLDPYFFH